MVPAGDFKLSGRPGRRINSLTNEVGRAPRCCARANLRPTARQRAEVIFEVRCGQMTATAAAQERGISRQQYYQWEQPPLQALLSSLED